MEGQLRREDLLARVSGDEFIILLPGSDAASAADRIRDIRDTLETTRQGAVAFRFSYGITTFPQRKKDSELLIREADIAMYRDKMQRHRKEARQ